jgi:hypothetical protein
VRGLEQIDLAADGEIERLVSYDVLFDGSLGHSLDFLSGRVGLTFGTASGILVVSKKMQLIK